MNLDPSARVHFVGIGGAGMSAIAKVLMERGYTVSGSDLKAARASAMLQAMGADIHEGHDAALVDGAGAVIVSSAIPSANAEYRRAEELGVPLITRGEALAFLLADLRSIVVAGTHGKTTTTSMIVTILRNAGSDPTYLVGAGLNDVGTNARAGSDDIAVAEADESDGSFLLLHPFVGVVTNMEMDHVDHWGSLAALEAAFGTFMEQVHPEGRLVLPGSNGLHRLAPTSGAEVTTFGVDGGDVHATDIRAHGEGISFTLHNDGRESSVDLRVPGVHNVANALAGAAACLAVGVSLDDVAAGLSRYRGVERRFQRRGESRGVTVIDDYAHHPTEVKAVLAAARSGPWKRVLAVFQPHRYTRTSALASQFGGSFADADRIVLMDVYGAGEQPVPGVSGKTIADSVCNALPGRSVAYFPHRAELIAYLERCTRPGDALLTLGAGDVTTVGEELLEKLGSRDEPG
ncbi:MAG: UDP-N-acetylmuramate--alanine ligase [Actinomycetota bacterium]|nr:UDP-N-acetylmuramate--alanine ligase [Actinomycetota bacterium]